MKAEINVTPLVDIVLVLLIIFIVITPAVSHAVQLPTARHGVHPSPGAPPLTLILPARRSAAGAVEGAEPVRVEGLTAPGHEPAAGPQGDRNLAFDLGGDSGRRALVAFIQRSPAFAGGGQVLIKADQGLRFKDVNDLLQLVREAGVAEASVVTREEAASAAGGTHG